MTLLETQMDSPPRGAHDPFETWQPGTIWHYRSKIAGDWLADADHVVDIGCGPMELRKFLSPQSGYTPVDQVPRSRDSVTVDLNHQPMPNFNRPVAAALGVLEYMDDPERFIAELRQFKRVVISYNHRTLHRLFRKGGAQWANSMSDAEVRAKFRAAGFRIAKVKALKIGEKIYDLHRASD